MARRSNTLWLDFRAGLGETLMEEHLQSYSAFHTFPCPWEQTPQLIALIGGRVKTISLEKIRPSLTTSKVNPGEIHIRIDNEDLNDESPKIYVDCELHTVNAWKKVIAGRCSGDIVRRPLQWSGQTPTRLEPEHLASRTYSRLLSPFTTLICFFSADLGGFSGIARMLVSWLQTNMASDLHGCTRPRVLVFEQCTARQGKEKLLTREFLFMLGQELEKVFGKLSKSAFDGLLAKHFGGFGVMILPSTQSKVLWNLVHKRMLLESEEAYRKRKASRCSFTVEHFQAFLHMACDHFCKNSDLPFNFIKSSRLSRPIPGELNFHVSAFLEFISPKKELYHFAAPIISSSLALESGPPGMHVFEPSAVFRAFYRETCEATVHHLDPVTSKKFLGFVEQGFCSRLAGINSQARDNSEMHRRTLVLFKNKWHRIRSNRTCLSCLARTPEHALPCGHSFCEICVRTFGLEKQGQPWTFTVAQCILCYGVGSKATFRLKPPTAGVRILSLDGGGTRGVISLQWLRELETALNFSCPAHDYFDLAVGTSSGALIVLALFVNGWSTAECMDKFKGFAKLAFRGRMSYTLPFFSRLFETIMSIITDSRYNTSNLEKALRDAYGTSQTMFWNNNSKAKVAITATTTEDSNTCVFSNYNGSTIRPGNCGYRLVRAVNPADELRVWEVARVSSAAPPFFKSFQKYHDGGLGGHNNPIKLALWEYRHIWPTEKQPDVIVSLGTGASKQKDNAIEEIQNRRALQNRFLPRLFRSFMLLLDGQRTWNDLWNSLTVDERARYHRLNIEFDGPEPLLDDVSTMEELERKTKICAASSVALSRCVDNLISSLFYLELQQTPLFERTHFVCKGYICCRWGPNSLALQQLLDRMIRKEAKFYINGKAVPAADDETLAAVESGEPFKKKIQFEMLELSDSVHIFISGLTTRPRTISNCPYIINTLIKDQELDCPFGRSDHRKRKRDTTRTGGLEWRGLKRRCRR